MSKKKWYIGHSPESRERVAQREIYDLLPKDGSEIQWSKLKQAAEKRGISSATLSKHLKSGVKIGVIRRRVDESTYPPKVYYRHNPPKLRDYPLSFFDLFEQLDIVEQKIRNRQLSKEEVSQIVKRFLPVYLRMLGIIMEDAFYTSLAITGQESIEYVFNVIVLPRAQQIFRIFMFAEETVGVPTFPVAISADFSTFLNKAIEEYEKTNKALKKMLSL